MGGDPSQRGVNWNKAIEFLHCFGKHVWFLEIHFAHTCSLNLCKIILDVLQLVPNLKSLAAQAESISHFRDSTQEIEKLLESLPPLDHLETLKYPVSCDALPEVLCNALLGRYSAQIRRLCIHQETWLRGHSNHFPNLTEFVFPTWDRYHCERKMMHDVLHSLKTSSKLSSLDLLLRSGDREQDLGWGDVVSWLTPFPRMESLHLILKQVVNWGPRDNPNQAGWQGIVPSMKSLWIEQERCDWIKVNIRLLTCFPTLEYLKITSDLDANAWVDLETEGMIIAIFRELPKLKEVTIQYFRLGEPRAFRSRYLTRGRYDLMEREKAQQLSDMELDTDFAYPSGQ